MKPSNHELVLKTLEISESWLNVKMMAPLISCMRIVREKVGNVPYFIQSKVHFEGVNLRFVVLFSLCFYGGQAHTDQGLVDIIKGVAHIRCVGANLEGENVNKTSILVTNYRAQTILRLKVALSDAIFCKSQKKKKMLWNNVKLFLNDLIINMDINVMFIIIKQKVQIGNVMYRI